MKLINVIIEASKTSHSFGLRRKQAETVLRAVTEWITEQGIVTKEAEFPIERRILEALAQRMRDEILIGRTPK